MNASLKQFWVWMLFVKQNLGWEKLPFLFCQHCNRLSLLLVKLLPLFYATLESWLIRYLLKMKWFPNIYYHEPSLNCQIIVCFAFFFPWDISLLCRSVTSLSVSAHTCLISRLLCSMVVWISKSTRIFSRMNALISWLELLVEFLHYPEIRTYLWGMWGISSWMNVTRCLNHWVC